jgi:acyl carrier protein
VNEWNQDAINVLIKDILSKNLEQAGVSVDEIDDDEDLYASGILDSYGLVDLLSEVEQKTGLEAEWHMAIPDGASTDSPLVISVNGLSRALVKNKA